MLTTFNFPLYDGCLDEFGTMAEVARDCRETGCDGLEVIWDHADYHGELPGSDLAIGYHLVFWSDWLKFWRGDHDALIEEFGDDELIEEYYHGTGRSAMIERYRTDLQRAVDLGARYVVFHVSDVSLEETLTYRWHNTDEEVIDAAIECINLVLDGQDYPFAFFVENQWWPGFTFTRPEMTARLLDGIEYGDKGIMLDIGHLLSTNRDLCTDADAIAYIHRMLDEHRSMAGMIRGVHLHESLSGEYVKRVLANPLPADFTGSYWDKYMRSYQHVVSIDRHQPWTSPAIAGVIERIAPEFLNNELLASGRKAHKKAVQVQMDALREGGLSI